MRLAPGLRRPGLRGQFIYLGDNGLRVTRALLGLLLRPQKRFVTATIAIIVLWAPPFAVADPSGGGRCGLEAPDGSRSAAEAAKRARRRRS